jgi:hypothetical protein
MKERLDRHRDAAITNLIPMRLGMFSVLGHVTHRYLGLLNCRQTWRSDFYFDALLR